MIIITPLINIARGFTCVFAENRLQHIWIPSRLNRPWTADLGNRADETEQPQEKAASTCPAHVFAYCMKFRKCQCWNLLGIGT